MAVQAKKKSEPAKKKCCKLDVDEGGPPGSVVHLFQLFYLKNLAHAKNLDIVKMKVLSLNFVNCAAKACKATSESFPLHPKDAELVQDEIELNPAMLINVLPRLDWAALRTTSSEVRTIAL